MIHVLGKLNIIFNKYPISRGMVAYSILWPVSNLCQQKMSGKRKLDFVEAARYAILGGLWMSPAVYTYVRIFSTIWPGDTLRALIPKVSRVRLTFSFRHL